MEQKQGGEACSRVVRTTAWSAPVRTQDRSTTTAELLDGEERLVRRVEGFPATTCCGKEIDRAAPSHKAGPAVAAEGLDEPGDGERLRNGVPDGLEEGDQEGCSGMEEEGVEVIVDDADRDKELDGEDEAAGVAEGEGEGDGDLVDVEEVEVLGLGVLEGEGEGEGVLVRVGVPEGEREMDGVLDGDGEA